LETKPQDRKSGTKKIVFLSLVTVTIFFLSFTSVYLKISESFLLQELQFYKERIKLLEENQSLIKEIKKLKRQNIILARFFNLSTEVEVTAYAPLCPSAITGWDYSGDPRITASGEEVVPWKTAAAGHNIPFGSYVLIEGNGLWRINDRGGLIGPQNIDIAVNTTQEARNFGRQRLQAVFLSAEEAKHLKKTFIPLD